MYLLCWEKLATLFSLWGLCIETMSLCPSSRPRALRGVFQTRGPGLRMSQKAPGVSVSDAPACVQTPLHPPGVRPPVGAVTAQCCVRGRPLRSWVRGSGENPGWFPQSDSGLSRPSAREPVSRAFVSSDCVATADGCERQERVFSVLPGRSTKSGCRRPRSLQQPWTPPGAVSLSRLLGAELVSRLVTASCGSLSPCSQLSPSSLCLCVPPIRTPVPGFRVTLFQYNLALTCYTCKTLPSEVLSMSTRGP